MSNTKPRRLPSWLRRPLPAGESFAHTDQILKHLEMQTICVHANCPNRGQCWARGTATVLILGDVCTRNCRFCSVAGGKPQAPDPTEPQRLADMVGRMGLHYLVITSVNRDDLSDGGAAHFRDCVQIVRHQHAETRFELLVPDFRHCETKALTLLEEALPFVFAHNVETVPSLYASVRPGADYQGSLSLLRLAKNRLMNVTTKSSLMLGLGETDAEVKQVLQDLVEVGCERLTIGQYLRPSPDSLEVVDYIHPDRFDQWHDTALSLGFTWVLSAPFARSSYFAEQSNPQTKK